jgi:DNA polymerase III epsilon subunit family exonuclease
MDELKDYCVIDTETTGFSPQRNEIIEIAAIRVRNNEIVEKFAVLVKPIIMPDYHTINVHKIYPEMLKNQKGFAEVFTEFQNFIKDDLVLGYNIAFDVRMIEGNCIVHSIDYKMKNKIIDVWQYIGGKLSDHVTKLGFGCQEHRALQDTIHTHMLFQHIKNTKNF